MFTHVMVGSSDPERARRFYDAVFGALGIPPSRSPAGANRHFYFNGGPAFGVGAPLEGEACHANGGTIGFAASSAAEVDAFHTAGLERGGSDAGAPGVREQSPGQMYGAYLRDPDGNKLCAFAPNPNAAT